MFKIYDGREHFWQWDLNQKLIVEDPEINEVHFCNRTDDCSLVVEVVDGLANVPNILLQQDWKIKVYAYSVDHTKHEACFKVKTRSKPADYVYTETEIKSWEAYGERIAALEENGGGIAELPEGDNFIADLATGIYKVNGADGSSTLWLDDAYWLGIVDGVVIVENPQDSSDIKWAAIGLDTSWTSLYYTGTTSWKTDDEYWECISFGDVEHTGNRVNAISKASIDTYPSTEAVVNYINDFKDKEIPWSKIYSYDTTEMEGKYAWGLYPMFELSFNKIPGSAPDGNYWLIQVVYKLGIAKRSKINGVQYLVETPLEAEFKVNSSSKKSICMRGSPPVTVIVPVFFMTLLFPMIVCIGSGFIIRH